MRNTTFAKHSLPVLALLLLWACGGEAEEPSQGGEPGTGRAGQEKKQEPAGGEERLPDGYPDELTLPPGFKPGDLKTGSGSVSGGNTGRGTFKSFELWKMFPGNAPAIIAHYKKLLAGLNYEGEWKGDGQESAWGEFTRGRHRLNLSINEEKFSFNLRVFD